MAAGLLTAAVAQAQEEPKFTAKPSGRILMDAAYINAQHQEDDLKSGIATPDPGNMELCLQNNYTNLHNESAGVLGGKLHDWALCYNFYPNKYMIWRVRASYTKVVDRGGFEDNGVTILETRLQVKF